MYVDTWVDLLDRTLLDAKYRHPVMERLDGLFRVSLGVQESYAIC